MKPFVTDLLLGQGCHAFSKEANFCNKAKSFACNINVLCFILLSIAPLLDLIALP